MYQSMKSLNTYKYTYTVQYLLVLVQYVHLVLPFCMISTAHSAACFMVGACFKLS